MIISIKKIIATLYQTNNYLVEFESGFILIEASATKEEIKKQIGDKPLLGVFLTHSHFDHAFRLKEIIQYFDVDCYLHGNAIKEVINHKKNFYGDRPFQVDGCEARLIPIVDGESVEIGENVLQVIETLGHTSDGLSFLVNKILFSGDTLFCDGVGRSDLPTGNNEELMSSLKRLLKLSDDVVVYPGHGEQTTIGNERHYWEGNL